MHLVVQLRFEHAMYKFTISHVMSWADSKHLYASIIILRPVCTQHVDQRSISHKEPFWMLIALLSGGGRAIGKVSLYNDQGLWWIISDSSQKRTHMRGLVSFGLYP